MFKGSPQTLILKFCRFLNPKAFQNISIAMKVWGSGWGLKE